MIIADMKQIIWLILNNEFPLQKRFFIASNN